MQLAPQNGIFLIGDPQTVAGESFLQALLAICYRTFAAIAGAAGLEAKNVDSSRNRSRLPVRRGSEGGGLDLRTAPFLNRESDVTSVCPNVTSITQLRPSGNIPSQSVKGPKVQDRTPRSFLKAVSGRLLEKVAHGRFEKYEVENYRLAALVVEAVRDGRSNPYEFCIAVHYNGVAPKPSPKAIPFNYSCEQYFAQKEESGSLPEHFDGRDSKQWVASVVAYLQFRLTSTTTDRKSRLDSAYHDALIVVDRASRGLDLPEAFRRRTNSSVKPTVLQSPVAIPFARAKARA